MTSKFYVGLMSGTSLDGVDAVLADFSGAAPRVVASAHHAFDPRLRAEILSLNSPGGDEIGRAALAANELARRYAACVGELYSRSGVKPDAVAAIGCHGQTVRHRPDLGYTVQLGNAALLAELTGIRVVADFRSRDVAAGGQGAPLTPVFHAAVFASRDEDRAVLNLGGIANLTSLPRDGAIIGFDSGPGNCLLDLWASIHLGKPYDDSGDWAAGGKLIPELLERMLGEPFFSAPPPKSTGRDLFSESWLRSLLNGKEEPRAVQATLLELTARSVADSIVRYCPGVKRIVACGGGARNRALMRRLADLTSPAVLETSACHGIEPQLVEAAAFAWLAKRALDGAPASLPSVTGARGPRVLGAIYPP